jgi:hypothetical protein
MGEFYITPFQFLNTYTCYSWAIGPLVFTVQFSKENWTKFEKQFARLKPNYLCIIPNQTEKSVQTEQLVLIPNTIDLLYLWCSQFSLARKTEPNLRNSLLEWNRTTSVLSQTKLKNQFKPSNLCLSQT